MTIANGGTGSSTAAAALTALGAQEKLVSGTNIKTVNGESILGAGNINISENGEGGANFTNQTIRTDQNDASQTLFYTDYFEMPAGLTFIKYIAVWRSAQSVTDMFQMTFNLQYSNQTNFAGTEFNQLYAARSFSQNQTTGYPAFTQIDTPPNPLRVQLRTNQSINLRRLNIQLINFPNPA